MFPSCSVRQRCYRLRLPRAFTAPRQSGSPVHLHCAFSLSAALRQPPTAATAPATSATSAPATSAPAPAPAPAPPHRLPLLGEEGDDLFSSARGFFPLGDNASTAADEAAQLLHDVDSLTETGSPSPLPEPTVTGPLFPLRSYYSKADFSHLHPRALVAHAPTVESAPKQSIQPLSPTSTSSSFRSSGNLRWMTAAYIDHLDQPSHPQNASNLPNHDTIATIFTEPRVRYLHSRGYDVEDVLTWAWILTSPSADRAINRFIAVDEEKQAHGNSLIPHFVILQLLRTPHINADSLVRLVARLCVTTDHASSSSTPDSHSAQDQSEVGSRKSWDSESATVLLIRLIRHARRVHPATVEDVPTLASRILLPLHSSGPTTHELLAFACNRLLTLISLPSGPRPFQSVIYQQRAQLALIRAMTHQKPQIPLNREGYRALIKVQLAHEKLDRERAWAEAQGDSWPPWPKPKLGIDETKDYPGKVSRAMRVLRRMVEAGYAHFTWEKAAAVLAGWDTDRSPTVQTRHLLKPARQAPLAEAVSKADSSLLIAQLWASRVAATRSIREAWACFESYRRSADTASRRYEPYHAMFTKLIARNPEEASLSQRAAVPGDAREPFPDPASPRDLVYIESQPASVADLYQQMRADGVKPVGRLLTDLTNHASTIGQASLYLRDSGYSELKKDALLDARKYSDDQIKNIVQGVPQHFFAAYLSMLVRCKDIGSVSDFSTTPPWWRNDNSRGPHTRALRYALRLLYLSGSRYLPAWNGLLQSLHVRMSDSHLSSFSFKQMCHSVRNLVHQLRLQRIDTDFATFRTLVAIINICDQRHESPSSTSPSGLTLHEHAKELYTRAVYKVPTGWISEVRGKDVLAWPEPEDCRALIETLGVAGDRDALLCFADWMHTHADGLMAVEERRQKSVACLRNINNILLRVFLEASWAESEPQRQLHSVSQAELTNIKQCFEKSLGWPDDEEVQDFLDSRPAWLVRVRQAVANKDSHVTNDGAHNERRQNDDAMLPKTRKDEMKM